MTRPRMEAHQVVAALAGAAYPARRWQLIAQADYYGADIVTKSALARLPDTSYPNLATVLAAVAAGVSVQRPTPTTPRP